MYIEARIFILYLFFFFPLNLLRLIRRTVYENNDSLVYVEFVLEISSLFDGEINSTTDSGETRRRACLDNEFR